jgi:hypothetical protein
VDDIAWVVVGEDINQCLQQMQSYMKKAKEWAAASAVEVNMAKTEAVLFSRKRNHQGGWVRMKVEVN